MLVLGKIMDAGLEEEEHKLQGDGYVNFVEWAMPHDPKNPKKREIAVSRDKIISKLLDKDHVVIVNLAEFDMVGHIIRHTGPHKQPYKEKGKGGAEGEEDNGEDEKAKEFRLKQYEHISFHMKPKKPKDEKNGWLPK